MNKYQKEKSREIRDIMRANYPLKVTYKEAKRKHRKGIRAFRIGEMYAWKEADMSHIGFNRKQLRDVGKAFYKVLTYCGERNLAFNCYYEANVDSYILRFTGRSVDGKRFGIMHAVNGDSIRYYVGSLLDIVHRVLEEVNCRLQKFIFPDVIKTDLNAESLYPRIILHDWKITSPETALCKIIEKENRPSLKKMEAELDLGPLCEVPWDDPAPDQILNVGVM